MRRIDMDPLISRVVKGRASAAEEAQVRSWRRTSPENDRYYMQLSQLLEEAEAAAWNKVPPRRPPIRTLTDTDPDSNSSPRIGWAGQRVGRWVVGGLTAAAAVLIALLTPSYFSSPDTGSSTSDLFLGSGEVVTGAAEMVTVTLGDGTIVRLAPSSRLRITQQPGTREVWLEGRAFFAVVGQNGQPFRVRTHAGNAVVLGTRFDLQARQDELRLLVVEGAVNLDGNGSSIDVGASQVGRIKDTLPPVREEVDEAYLEEERRWLGNFLVFESTPLVQAAAEISSHYGVPVQVLDERIGATTVRGAFADEELEDVVQVLCRAVSAYCSVSQSGVVIGP